MSYSKRIYDNAIKGIPELAFNNTYDVDFVSHQTLDVRDQLFTRCLEVQKRNCGINIITGKMNEFKQNYSLARTFDLPISTYFNRIDNKFLNYFSEKDALYKLALKEDPIVYPSVDDIAKGYPFSPYYIEILPQQGCQYRHYTLYDVCKNNRIFQRRLLFYFRQDEAPSIISNLYMDLLIIPTKTSTYLAIQVTGSGSFQESYLKTLIEKKTDWYIYETKAGNLWLNTEYPTSSFITEGNYTFIPHNFSSVRSNSQPSNSPYYAPGANGYLLAIPDVNGCWKITDAIYAKTSEGTYGYRIEKNFVSNLSGNTKILILNERQLGHIIRIASRSQSTLQLSSPTGIFQIDLQKNPIPPENILCFLQDPETKALYPMPDAKITFWYPNVYKVEYRELDYEDPYIYAFAYYDPNATTRFINPIANYMKYRGLQYINDCINGTHPASIANYIPKSYEYSIEDYHKDDTFKQDKPYQYTMNQDVWMLLDDPNRYIDVFRKVVPSISRHNTYFYELKVSELNLLSRKVRNNYSQIQNPSKQKEFSEDMCFIEVNTRSDEEIPVWLFIDQYRILHPEVYIEGFTQYLYFPYSLLSENSIITIEIFDVHDSDIIHANLYFDEINKDIPFPEEFEHFSDQNLIFYDKDTQKIIPNSDFRYGIFIDIEKDHILTSELEYLKTVNDEFVITGSHMKLATSNTGFYKNVGTRLSIQNIDFSGTPIYTTVYRNNHLQITNPAMQREWDEDMLCIEIEAHDACYPTTMIIDTISIPFNKIYKYFQYDITDKIMHEYIFFPKSYAVATSKAKITTLIAKKWEFIKNIVSFQSTGQLCIYTINTENIGKNIIVQSTDAYKWDIFKNGSNTLSIQNFILDPKKDRFRLWKRNIETRKATRINPKNFTCEFSPNYGGTLIITHNLVNLEDTDEIIAEYLPFRSTEKTVFENPGGFDKENILSLYGYAERPIDRINYEIYMNGLLMPSSYCTIITPTKIKFAESYSIAEIELVEKSHDPDVYGNRYRKMTLEEQLMTEDDEFNEWMKENF